MDVDAAETAEVVKFDDELLLTRACLRGDKAAQKHVLAFCKDAAVRVKGAHKADDVAELASELVSSLCVAPPGETPKLAMYRGAGPLHAWLHVCAVRQSLRTQSKAKTVSIEDPVWERIVSDALPPSLSFNRESLVKLMRENLSSAIAGLDDRQRQVLRMRLIEGHSIDAIGEEFGVHRATAARWVDDVRETMRKAMFASLKDKSGLSTADFESMCRQMTGSIYATLADHLKAGVTP